jgi:hypothetical protein
MTTGALLVTDGDVAKYGIGGAQSKPELNFGLELLAHGSGRILVAVAAGKRVMSSIWRTFGMETHDLRYHHYGCDGRRGDDTTQHIGNDLDRSLAWRIGSR